MSAINIKSLTCEKVLNFLRSFDTVLTDCDGEWKSCANMRFYDDSSVDIFFRSAMDAYDTSAEFVGRDESVSKAWQTSLLRDQQQYEDAG